MSDIRYMEQRRRERLDKAFGRYSAVGNNTEVQADFARYLSVLVSGYVEQIFYEVAHEFARKRSNERILRFVGSTLERFQNPTSEKIATVIGRFDSRWKETFEDFVKGGRKEALNSVVAIRHNVAHGEHVGVTFGQLSEMLPKVYEIVDFLVDLFET